MPYFLCFIGLFATLLMPVSSLASEDSAPFMFGGDTNYETVIEGDTEGGGTDYDPSEWEDPGAPPIEQSALPDYTPPPSNQIAIPEQTPQIPMLQTKRPETEEPTEETKPVQPRISKNQGLTDTIKQASDDSESAPILPLPDVQGTWVDKLSSANPLSLIGSTGSKDSKAPPPPDSSLEDLVEDSRLSRKSGTAGRSNASVFDISGVMLRMTVKQVNEVMQNRGFRKILEKFQIPNFIKWRNEEKCRTSGVTGYERIEACVNERSKKEKQQYIQIIKFTKFDTREEIEVTFTSNFTENRVYKITYKSLAPSVTGNSPKAIYLRNIKIFDFWKKINQKYGKPDDTEAVTWGLGGNKPYLKAKTGWLMLEDPMFRELDYTRMSREDQRYMNTDMYSF